MVKTRLRSTIFVDLPSGGGITNFHFYRSFAGKVNVFEEPSSVNFWVQRSLTGKINTSEVSPELGGNIRKGLISAIDTDNSDEVKIIALRRSNISIPPCGELYLLSAKGESKFKQSSVRRGDTHIINLVAYGDFPSLPKIVFAIKTDLNPCTKPLVVKDTIPILSLEDINNYIGTHQKLNAQIVIYPGETATLETTKTLFYTCEIVDKQADEVYTLETGNFTIHADVYNYFSNQ